MTWGLLGFGICASLFMVGALWTLSVHTRAIAVITKRLDHLTMVLRELESRVDAPPWPR